ncbi:MAG: M48 family metallopeptidase [Gammaproteobacteria bacterium]|nr:M48 family metallopeptidase [Gammaproteobacteria bacterium]
MLRRLIRLTTILVVLILPGCETVPETGRSQLLLISPDQETELGLTEFEKLKSSTPVSEDAELNAMLQRVGQRVAAVAPLPNARWEFVLFDDPNTANAFCLPGGKVGIYTGILPVTKDENGLATVIGHEVAHAVARHGGERVSQALILQMGGEALESALSSQPAQTRSLVLQGYGLGSKVGVILPYSRAHELEADELGLLYMARAGYDPRSAVDFWQRFSAYTREKGGAPPEFLSTHPIDTRRIAQIEALMPKALAEYQKAGGK